MENKEKLNRKKSLDLKNLPLPAAPPLPEQSKQPSKPTAKSVKNEPDPFSSLYMYKDRESAFLKSLSDNLRAMHHENNDKSLEESDKNNMGHNCEKECHGFILPFLSRTNYSVSTVLATKDSIDQLDKLYDMIKQLLTIQEQNYRMRRTLKTVETLQSLKKMEFQIKTDPEKFMKNSVDEISDTDLWDVDFEQNMAELEAVLLASKSASNKRNNSKRQRSKSVIAEDISPYSETSRNYPLRRQSAISDFKPKVSKWTKVKAAFKWEKANAFALNESKSSDSILSPNNHELARYLRVPSTQCQGSSGESIFSSSSGRILSGISAGSGLTPAELSSASGSSCDENEFEKTLNKKKVFRSHSQSQDEDIRRSRSLDGEMILGPTSVHMDKNKNKSAWSKVKGIVKTHKSSGKAQTKSSKSTSGVSRDVSPCDSNEIHESTRDRTDSQSSNQQSPGISGPFSLQVPEGEIQSCPSSPIGSMPGNSAVSSDDNDSRSDGKSGKTIRTNKKGSRKSKHVPDIESLPEGVPLDTKSIVKRPPPSPLNIQQKDPSESDGLDGSSPTNMQTKKWNNKIFNTSVPNSPSRHSEFFSENDYSSGANTPQKRSSYKKTAGFQRDEIMKEYHELQKRLNNEFEKKQAEWEKMRPLIIALNTATPNYLKEDSSGPSTPKSPVPPVIREDNLSPHFKKKLDEWRLKKSQGSKEAAPRQNNDPKKKITQTKSDGSPAKIPDAKDLPEDFQKKLNEWKQMKAENRVPSYSQQTQSASSSKRSSAKSDSPKAQTYAQTVKKSKTSDDMARVEGLSKLKALVAEPVNKEVVVKTSEGVLKFEGISRKFTRKLYEWEKARGIGPESSTFALLHPGYKPVVVEHCDTAHEQREKSPGIKRRHSIDSINPKAMEANISHQPSSLSLNNADDFKETDLIVEDKTIATSNPEFYDRCKHDVVDHDMEEPEAVIVEVEDEIVEVTAPLSASIVQKQIPVFKFEKKESENVTLESNGNLNLIKEICDINENAMNIVEIMCKSSEYSLSQIKHLINVYKFINQMFSKLAVPKNDDVGWSLSKKAMECSYNSFRLLEEIEEYNAGLNVEQKMLHVYNHVESLKSILENLIKHFEKPAPINIPEINVTSAFGHQATQTVQNFDDSQKSVATVIVTPTFVCNAVKIDEVKNDIQISTTSHLEVAESSMVSTTPFSSESEIPYTTDNTKDERGFLIDESRKVTRNTSNGSKRRTRVRRLGSRQNSKTESDSEEEQTSVTNDTPRKLKRKTSKCKKSSEVTENQNHLVDEVVYVFKIKPGEKNELVTSKQDLTQQKSDENILISPTETCVQLIDPSNDHNSSLTNPNITNVIIKTKRKIFSPVDNSDAGSLSAVVGQDVESSSASDKNDNSNSDQILEDIVQNKFIVSNLPPLPQSPKFPRKSDPNKNANKELSPNIRIMIQKYNKKLTNENKANSPHSSGSCSPIAWRSPVLDRRVRKQTEQYQEKVEQQKENFNISKSSSESKISDQLREKIYINKTDNLVLTKVNSVDEATQTSEVQDDLLEYSIENSIDKSSAETVVLKDSIEIPLNLEISAERRKSLEDSVATSTSTDTTSAPTLPSLQEKLPQVPSTPSTPAISYTNVKDFSWSESSYEDSPCLSLVNMRYDENKPRTPLSERALRIKQAKEAFLKMPLSTNEDNEIKWSYRMSQISVGSAESSSFDEISISKSANEETPSSQEVNTDTCSSSPALRNTSASSESTETVGAVAKPNRFGLSSIATKLRKVKLMKSNKDIPKLNTVQQLCRQSLAFDITNASGSKILDTAHTERAMSSEHVPKSSSSHGIGISSRFKKSDKNEKIKKSKSMGGLPESSEDK